MRWLALLFLLGCDVLGPEVGPEADVDVDTDGDLDCDEALDAVDTVLLGNDWDLVEEARPVWSPEAAHLGDARVYTSGGRHVLTVASEDPAVADDWSDGHPSACPMLAYQESCDEVWCDGAVDDPCAQLLQVPCHVSWDYDYYRDPTVQFLRDLE